MVQDACQPARTPHELFVHNTQLDTVLYSSVGLFEEQINDTLRSYRKDRRFVIDIAKKDSDAREPIGKLKDQL